MDPFFLKETQRNFIFLFFKRDAHSSFRIALILATTGVCMCLFTLFIFIFITFSSNLLITTVKTVILILVLFFQSFLHQFSF